MIEIPYTKLQAAENDFLLTWLTEAPSAAGFAEVARLICARNTGIGADGWMLVERFGNGLRTRLFNSDGSEAEISGNGTRCAAAFALLHNIASGSGIEIVTAAGLKRLRLISHAGLNYCFEMDMGQPKTEALHETLHLAGRDLDAALLNVGNPQCVFLTNELPPDWLAVAREAECHKRFPNRTNVSFVIPIDRHTLSVVFFERGAGETRSSGTGSAGAAAAAILRDVAESPIDVRTPAGSLHFRWEESMFLTGPAAVIGEGRFLLEL